MSKHYNFARHRFHTEFLSQAQLREREEQGLPPQERISLDMDPNLFLEKLFGVEDFLFIPIQNRNSYSKNMVEQGISRCLFLLNQAKEELNEDLFEWMNHLLQSIHHLLQTDGWHNNRSLQGEVDAYNKRLEAIPFTEAHINEQHQSNPFLTKKLLFYVDNEKNKITTDFTTFGKEFNNVGFLILFEEKGLSSVQQLECGINFLYEFINSLKNGHRYDEEIHYEWGQTDLNIHQEYINTLKTLARCMSYLVHTTSWRKNEFYAFDEFEIRRKASMPLNNAFCSFFENQSVKES